MAQAKACKWARKQKQGGAVVPLAMGLSKHHKFNIITTKNEDDKDKIPPPFITVVQFGIERVKEYAFIDSRLDGSTISYELLKTLKNVYLKDINVVFQSYTCHKTRVFGVCKLDLDVSELICGDKFFVTLL